MSIRASSAQMSLPDPLVTTKLSEPAALSMVIATLADAELDSQCCRGTQLDSFLKKPSGCKTTRRIGPAAPRNLSAMGTSRKPYSGHHVSCVYSFTCGTLAARFTEILLRIS